MIQFLKINFPRARAAAAAAAPAETNESTPVDWSTTSKGPSGAKMPSPPGPA